MHKKAWPPPPQRGGGFLCAGRGGGWGVPGRQPPAAGTNAGLCGRAARRNTSAGAGPPGNPAFCAAVPTGHAGSSRAARRKNRLHFCRGFAILYKLPQRAAPAGAAYCAVVAQLDRALDSDSKGQRFESPRPHQKRSLYCRTATFFIFLGLVLVNPLLTLRGNIGHDRHEKTDKIAHGISFPCWFCTSGSTRAILSVFVFMGRFWVPNLKDRPPWESPHKSLCGRSVLKTARYPQ